MIKKIINILLAEKESWILWFPVFFGIGTAIYFAFKFEPQWQYSVLLSVGLTFVCGMCRKNSIFPLLLIITTISYGFTAANIKTVLTNTRFIVKDTGVIMIKGVVDDIEPLPSGNRVILKNLELEGFDKEECPQKIRLNINKLSDDVEIDNSVSVLAVLAPPPIPVMPGAYDFSRYAYFSGVGATGYAVSEMKKEPDSSGSSIRSIIPKLRNDITVRIINDIGQRWGNIAAALLVGKRTGIDKSDTESMRNAGLAHILAISGMHLTLVATIFFFFSRAILALFENIALKYNIKKWAAVCAIIGSLTYLLISGAPISAQRAFVMTTLILISIIIDRTGTPMRSIAFAAMIVLIIEPESILSPSFQMSFAAVIALVGSYEFFHNRFTNLLEFTITQKILMYISGVMLSSIIAGLATAPFAIYHFNHFSLYGTAANLFVIPVTSFFIMPFGVLALLLMPFGLENIGLLPMSYGIDFMLSIAGYFSSLPSAHGVVKSLPISALTLIVLGGLWLFLWKTSWRYAGLVVIIIGICVSFFNESPDILIDGKGKLFAIKNNDGKLAFSSNVTARYSREIWMQKAGQEESPNVYKTGFCDEFGCVIRKDGKTAVIAINPIAVIEGCDGSDFIINLTSIYPDCLSKIKHIDKADLARNGSYSFIFKSSGIKVDNVRDDTGNRCWNSVDKC